MKVRYGLVDRLVEKLSKDYPLLNKAPVDIEKIVKRLGIDLIQKDFKKAMSGAAIVDADERIISINRKEPLNRKRFTIAHELGHILLHYDQELNVDLEPIRLNRDEKSTTGESWREIEANYFAACLLMPTELVRRYYSIFLKQCDDEDVVLESMSQKFQVSIQAMSIRLSKLGIISF